MNIRRWKRWFTYFTKTQCHQRRWPLYLMNTWNEKPLLVFRRRRNKNCQQLNNACGGPQREHRKVNQSRKCIQSNDCSYHCSPSCLFHARQMIFAQQCLPITTQLKKQNALNIDHLLTNKTSSPLQNMIFVRSNSRSSRIRATPCKQQLVGIFKSHEIYQESCAHKTHIKSDISVLFFGNKQTCSLAACTWVCVWGNVV